MDCECETVDDEESGIPYYPRVCPTTGVKWESLHCAHDGYQNPCPCGERHYVKDPDGRD